MNTGFSVFQESVAASNINTALVSRFVSEVLSAVPFIHFSHLMETNHARHQILGEWYQGIPSLIDGFVESLLIYDIDLKFIPTQAYEEPRLVLKSILESAQKLHTHLSTLGEVGVTNPLEDVITFTRQKLYKLTRLG
jgi:hypothetical protein